MCVCVWKCPCNYNFCSSLGVLSCPSTIHQRPTKPQHCFRSLSRQTPSAFAGHSSHFARGGKKRNGDNKSLFFFLLLLPLLLLFTLFVTSRFSFGLKQMKIGQNVLVNRRGSSRKGWPGRRGDVLCHYSFLLGSPYWKSFILFEPSG